MKISQKIKITNAIIEIIPFVFRHFPAFFETTECFLPKMKN